MKKEQNRSRYKLKDLRTCATNGVRSFGPG